MAPVERAGGPPTSSHGAILTKILLIVAVFAVIYFVMRSYARSLGAKPSAKTAIGEEDMVRCSHCGLHVPRGESHAKGGKFFCSEEHRKLHES